MMKGTGGECGAKQQFEAEMWLLFQDTFFFSVKHVFLTEIELNTLDERFIKLLAWQRIQQLLEPKPLPVQSDAKLPAIPSVTQRSRHTEGTVLDLLLFHDSSRAGTTNR